MTMVIKVFWEKSVDGSESSRRTLSDLRRQKRAITGPLLLRAVWSRIETLRSQETLLLPQATYFKARSVTLVCRVRYIIGTATGQTCLYMLQFITIYTLPFLFDHRPAFPPWHVLSLLVETLQRPYSLICLLDNAHFVHQSPDPADLPLH